MSDKSWWVVHRDNAEAAVASFFHRGVAYLTPVATKLAAQVTPAVESAMLNAGLAVEKAVAAGAVHGSDDVIAVARDSLRADVPHLEAVVSTALAASVVAQAEQAAVQATEDPGAPALGG